MSENKPYPTDDFGRPNGRDYHYRIPLNNDRAFRLAQWALNGMVHYEDRFVVDWDEWSGVETDYIGIQTRDSKGHINGLEEYAYSTLWQDGPRHSDIDEMRNANGGGTKVKGTFKYSPEPSYTITLPFQTVVTPTPTELFEAYENDTDVWRNVQDSIHWAKQDAQETYRQKKAEKQRECSHDHVVHKSDTRYLHLDNPDATGYCEDCQAEVTEENELAY